MVRALRVVTVQRGVDPREYALLAFGGAGPLHAVQIATELGIRRVLCPRASGVLAALGLIVSERRRDAQRSVFLSGDALTARKISETVSELGQLARRALGEREAEIDVVYELRYRGQSFELSIAAGPGATPAELRQAFEAEHEQRYGYADADQELELVTIRVAASTPGAHVRLAGQTAAQKLQEGSRTAVFDGVAREVLVLRGALEDGTGLTGPAIIELPESTMFVPPGWAGSVDETGTICLEAGQWQT
jgi:N-methylhydantoinase A